MVATESVACVKLEADLADDVGSGRRVGDAGTGAVQAGRGLDHSVQAVGEEHAGAVEAAQRQDVDQLHPAWDMLSTLLSWRAAIG